MRSRLAFFLRQAYKLSLYFAVPALSAIAPLIVVPAVTSQYGAEGWSSVAVAMSLGGGAAILAELGWGVVGPQRIARDPAGAHDTYQLSLSSKLLAIAVLAPVAVLTSSVLVTSYSFGAGLIAFGMVVGVISPGWYFIGKGRPLMVLATETVPKVGVAVLSATAISMGAPLEIYGGGLVLSTALGYSLAVRFGHLPVWPNRVAFLNSWSTIRNQAVVILGRGLSALYTALPTAILGAVNSGAVGVFSAADRPMRMGLSLLSGVPSRLQSWVGTPNVEDIRRRSQVSIWVNAGLGVIAATVYVLLAPTVIEILFSGVIDVSSDVVLLSGILAALICTSRGLGLALVAADHSNSITTAIFISALVGTSGLLSLGHLYGAAGAICALIVAEATGMVVQLISYSAAWRRRIPSRGRRRPRTSLHTGFQGSEGIRKAGPEESTLE